jgi:hypothetical protein
METANFDRGDIVTLAIDVIQNPDRVLKKIERSGPHRCPLNFNIIDFPPAQNSK